VVGWVRLSEDTQAVPRPNPGTQEWNPLRRALIAVLSILLLGLAMPVGAAVAASSAKVVVIVGPVGGSTAHYKDDADQVVAEARRYTSNVVKLYTPNATWSRVKAAVQGANVLVYLGHGNGWPSIYPPFQTVTKDGLGLDPSTGADSTKVVYYGEDFLRDNIRLAPNSVVLLYHLCYASGNTEPGLAVGTFTDSRLRVDNYGAGFIGAGARAVFAEGHPSHPVVSYIRQLFTTNRTMDQVFRAVPTYHGHLIGPYASQRTPGLTFEMDPDKATPSGFYRSLIGDRTMTAHEVVAPSLARTDTDPSDFVVPGAAEVTANGGAGLFATASTAADPAAVAPTTLDADTRLRVTSEAEPSATNIRILAVTVLGSTTKGFVRAPDVAPRDSKGVTVWTLDQSAPWLSPNGDNASDGLVVAARFSERATASFTVKNADGTTVKSLSLTTDLARFAWDLRTSAGALVPDGTYTWKLRAADAWGNPSVTRTGTFIVDGTAPVTTPSTAATRGANGWLVSSAAVTLTAKDGLSGVRSISWRLNDGSSTTYHGPVTVSANGTQTVTYRATDRAGIRETWKTLTLKIDTRAPTIAAPMAGKAGPVAGFWAGPVSISPSIRDATSGVVTKRYRIDGGTAASLGTAPIVVDGEGAHTVTVGSTDAAGNHGSVTVAFTIDTTAPTLTVPAPGDTVQTVTPNGDGIRETVAFPYTVDEPGRITAVVTDAAGAVVRTLGAASVTGDNAATWDGRTTAGAAAPDGRYLVTITPTDRAGNAGKPATVGVDVYGALKALTHSPSAFFPQDGDSLAAKTTAAYTLLAPATVTIRVLDRTGAVVRKGPTDVSMPKGAATWAWNGRNDAGAFVPRGTYRIVVNATNGTQGAAQVTSVLADAFRLSTSSTSATRGKALVLIAVTVEALSTAPKVYVHQPGLATWTLTMTKQSSTRWVVTVTPKKGGTTGTISLIVKAVDAKGGSNSSVTRLILR
jgi:flagellar hook assembly protein FlgD